MNKLYRFLILFLVFHNFILANEVYNTMNYNTNFSNSAIDKKDRCIGKYSFSFYGEPSDAYFGRSVCSAGDINGDGFDDFLIGANSATSDPGRVYLHFGGRNIDGVADIVFTEEYSEDNFGFGIASAGDVNGDGYSDIIISAIDNDDGGQDAGKVYLYFGGNTMDNFHELTMTGEVAGDNFGYSLASAGDINGDGYSDVIIGANRNDANGSNSGKIYIYFGAKEMDNSADIIIAGEASEDYFGYSVSSAGDINGDSFDDFMVGAIQNDENGNNAGKVYIYFGGKVIDNVADLTITGENANEKFGFSVAQAGDVNGDCFSDIMISSIYNSVSAPSAGKVYIYYGGKTVDNLADVEFFGQDTIDYFGRSISSAGDINCDGYTDVIVGAFRNDDGGILSGKAYIYHGGKTMDNTPDFTMEGEAPGDYFGYSVSSAGDVNNDGYSNVIIGAIYNDEAGTDAGKVYLVMNKAKGNINYSNIIISGENNDDLLGYSVSKAGDVNGDGFDDVIVGASQNDETGINAGKVYIHYGGQNMDNIADVNIGGEASYDRFGTSVSEAGDVNGDGYSDVIVGAYGNDENGNSAGKSYIFFGGIEMNNSADITMKGEAPLDYFGYSVSSAGDVNGDGYSDVIVGALFHDVEGDNTGKVYIYFGGNPMDGNPDVILIGQQPYEKFGYPVASAGDINGDGFSDIIVGAIGNNDNGEDCGKVYVFFGGRNMDNRADWYVSGENVGDRYGHGIASAGDINGDGFSDIIVSAINNDEKEYSAGKVYIYYGGMVFDKIADKIIYGNLLLESLGRAVSSAGDINGDGFSDIIIGTGYNQEKGLNAGKVNIYYGSVNMSIEPSIIMYGENQGDYFGYSLSSAGDVNGDGKDDIIIGSPYYDITSHSEGQAYIYTSINISANPNIFLAKDLPNDQGGKIILKWSRSSYDSFNGRITEYIVQRTENPIYGWENIHTLQAVKNRYYNSIVKTPNDYSPQNDAKFYYRILALTNYQDEYWKSNIVSCSSIDNISPIPASYIDAFYTEESQIKIIWNQNKIDQDISHFELHCSSISDFTPNLQTLKITTRDTSYIDSDFDNFQTKYYKVITCDIHGNKSLPSPQASIEIVKIVENEGNIPKDFFLLQNYPNPFNSSTIIEYGLPKETMIKLNIYDINGNLVDILENEYKQPGYYQIEWKPDGIPSGLYFYKILSREFTKFKKCILIK